MKKQIGRILAVVMMLGILTIPALAAEPAYQEVTFEARGMFFGHTTGKVTISEARAVMDQSGSVVSYYAVPEKVTITVVPYAEEGSEKASLVGLRYYDAVVQPGGNESFENMNHFLMTSAGKLKEIGDYSAFSAVDKNSADYALTANQSYTFTIDTTSSDRIDLLCSRPNDLGVEQVAVLRYEDGETTQEPETPTTPVFTDVAKDAYYADAVAWAVSQGITTGKTETTFSPDEICTRGHIVTFLYRDLAE